MTPANPFYHINSPLVLILFSLDLPLLYIATLYGKQYPQIACYSAMCQSCLGGKIILLVVCWNPNLFGFCFLSL
ncbi:uncharacterized protein BO95DRAFT_22042 [Aspergillus brunneoviolaceus CBS 621.78]|uniref:Uncharacterized protein n=1 Tax=Aspergillus brunneoviolaceus CBS 621.78 TaxID=1450534 RepID=A0ACD1FTE5_9EURO|nr:hypothetical protein BO95DRAFT_22042 [Aspergillus brunneoviolaceus CBS 621.78]RAH40232.1 hypothetical protein BO95DRAFT_22042 [Aspergillus brunneoviolaceus CBS 621.78]